MITLTKTESIINSNAFDAKSSDADKLSIFKSNTHTEYNFKNKLSAVDILLMTNSEPIKTKRTNIIRSYINDAPYDFYLTLTFTYGFSRDKSRKYLNGFIQRFNRNVNGNNNNRHLTGLVSEENKIGDDGVSRFHYHILLKREHRCNRARADELISKFNKIIMESKFRTGNGTSYNLYNPKAVDFTITKDSTEDCFRILKYMTKGMECSDENMDFLSPIGANGCSFGCDSCNPNN